MQKKNVAQKSNSKDNDKKIDDLKQVIEDAKEMHGTEAIVVESLERLLRKLNNNHTQSQENSGKEIKDSLKQKLNALLLMPACRYLVNTVTSCI